MSRLQQLARLENQLAQLIEGRFARLFAGRIRPSDLAAAMARAMHQQAEMRPNGELLAPSAYAICLHPEDCAEILRQYPDLPAQLAAGLTDLATQSGLLLAAKPVVEIATDADMPLHGVRVEVCQPNSTMPRHDQPRAATAQLSAIPLASLEPAPSGAQLIIQGARYEALQRPLINIGRRSENHIALDDARVSRFHAQIRLRFGRYVIYDVGSKSGVFVNGQRITEHVLRASDVIALGGMLLVYMEDDASSQILAAEPDQPTQRQLPLEDAPAEPKYATHLPTESLSQPTHADRDQ
jgi:Protein of unknown function (DUF3662)/FHA domain